MILSIGKKAHRPLGKGFALIEALLSVVVMAIGLTAVFAAMMQQQKTLSVGGANVIAINALHEKLFEKIFLDPTNVSMEPRQARGYPQGLNIGVDFKKPMGDQWSGVKQMDVMVTWAKADKRQWRLRTLLPDDESTSTKQSVFYN